MIRPTDSESESETEVFKPRRSTTRPALLSSDDDSEEEKQDRSSNICSAGNLGNKIAPLIVPKREKPDDGPSKHPGPSKGKLWKPTNTGGTNSTGRRSLTPEQVVSIIPEKDDELDIVKNEPDDGSESIPDNWMDCPNGEQCDEETEQDVFVKRKEGNAAVSNRQTSITSITSIYITPSSFWSIFIFLQIDIQIMEIIMNF